MRGLVVVAGLLAPGVAAADVTTLTFGGGHGLEGWTTPAATGFAIGGSELVQHVPGKFSRELRLDARGWTVEARFAIEERGAVEIVITDDRMTTRFTRANDRAALDGEQFELPNPGGMHTYRVEASAGRRLLLVDGQVVVDHDLALPAMVLDQPAKVELGASLLGARWQAVTVDTAPGELATSAHPYQPAVHFGGPFAPWLFRYAGRGYQIANQLAQLQLPEKARACVAFAIVASAATPRPRHYRKAELAKVPKNAPKEPMAIDFDLLESPRAARRPVMRPRRVPADIRAQGELAAALAAKDPAPFYDRAVNIIVNEGALTPEGQQWLLAELPGLATHPEACR